MIKPRTLFEKLWSSHVVRDLGDGRAIIQIDRHVLQEGTSPWAFEGLRKMNLKVRDPQMTFGVIDHSVTSMPGRTEDSFQPSKYRILAMRRNCDEAGIEYYDIHDPRQGITHVVAPELGIALPGTTLVCADSHTATNGALGIWAWGIGTTEVRHVLANQVLIQRKPKTMRIAIDGRLAEGVYAKDVILHLISKLGISGGAGYAVEYAGSTIRALAVEGRMTVCNMSIEFGARAGMIGVDDKAIEYIKGKPKAPDGLQFERAAAHWRDIRTDDGASFDSEFSIDCDSLSPQISWGTTPQDIIGIDDRVPVPAVTKKSVAEQTAAGRALDYMGLSAGQSLEGVPIDVAFIGSCTNARLSDLEIAARIVKGRKVAPHVRALVVPGSTSVKRSAEALGLDRVFKDAGFEWRESSCSMCVATNGDVVDAGQRCIATTNRNFEGRQGPESRTHMASPAMVAAAAVTGCLIDVRRLTACRA